MLAYRTKTVVIRAAVAEDVEYLKDKLRAKDVDELWAAHRHRPGEALDCAFRGSSLIWTIERKGRPVAMFGVAPVEERVDYGCVWLLASDELEKIKTTFLRASRAFINEMLGKYPVLFNQVDNRNKVSIEWLKWCGAAMALPAPYGPDGHLFRYFEIRRKP